MFTHIIIQLLFISKSFAISRDMSIFKKFGDWITPHRKHVYSFSEGSWDDRHLLGTSITVFCIARTELSQILSIYR